MPRSSSILVCERFSRSRLTPACSNRPITCSLSEDGPSVHQMSLVIVADPEVVATQCPQSQRTPRRGGPARTHDLSPRARLTEGIQTLKVVRIIAHRAAM